MTLLPDVNLWLALAFEHHVHHAVAKTWFDGLSAHPCMFCRMTQQGFLRLATNPKAFGEESLTLAQAWESYDALMADPRVSFAPEPTGVETFWRNYTYRQTFSPKLWNDAYLAAFARAAECRLITFDQAFTQYRDLDCTVLL